MRATLFLSFVAVVVIGVLALPAFSQFVKTLGGASYDQGNSVVAVSDGGFVVTGYTYSYGAGANDFLLAKFDGSGNRLWTKTLGGTGIEEGSSVVEVSDEGLVVVGYTSSYGAGADDFLETSVSLHRVSKSQERCLIILLCDSVA